MTDREFYANIVTELLTDIGEDVFKSMTESASRKVLRKILEVLEDDTLEDEICFRRIGEIVSVLEEPGPGAGSRRDFS